MFEANRPLLSARSGLTRTLLVAVAVLALALGAGFLAACGGGKDEKAPEGAAGGKLTLGKAVALKSAPIGAGGGDITIDHAGDPLDGLALKVPADSYKGERDFAVSYRPISKQSYGDRVHPISPLITVENGGGYADEVMAVKVPVKVPDGQFAMGFFYNEETGALEGMPLLAEDGSSVTIGTRHFSDFFISSIVESVLLNITIDSGFRPGVDDWQFTNYGSYIAPGGHCAGQSISAMWYYYERKLKGEPDLYGRYDNYLSDEEKTPDLWEDDNLAYRLASTVQQDQKTGMVFNLLRSLRGTNDTLQMLAFTYALHVTHAPQLVGLIDSVNDGGHAVVAYKVEAGSIWIADPNFPGVQSAEGKIEYVNGAFKPYRSALIADGDPTSFDKIGYNAVSALVDWEAVGARFAEMENGAVGDKYFPAYTFHGQSDAAPDEVPLIDGVSFPDAKFHLLGASDADLKGKYYREGQEFEFEGRLIPLQPGENKLGIAVRGWTGTDAEGNDIYKYVDFYRVTVIYNQVTIAPDPIIGNAGDDLSFAATMMPAQVKDARYEWDYGDGTPRENLTLKAKHVFAKQGEYTVTLTVYDGTTDRLVRRGKAVAKIGVAAANATRPASPAATSQAGTGAWLLTSTEPTKKVDEPRGCYNSQEVTLDGLSVTTSGKCTGWPTATDDVWQRSQHSWSAAPPQRLAPGEKLQITATVSLVGTAIRVIPGSSGTTSVRVDLSDGGGPQRGSVMVVATEGTSAADTTNFEVPGGSKGDVMWVTLTFSGIGGSGATKYIYEWQGP